MSPSPAAKTTRGTAATPSARPAVPAAVIATLRRICTALPEVREESAWVGTRWRIRQQTFAHVLMIDRGRPPAYAKVAGTDGPACVLTFRSPLPELDLYAFGEAPYFRPGWWPDIAGIVLDPAALDSAELGALLTESYCRLAPKKLAQAVRGA